MVDKRVNCIQSVDLNNRRKPSRYGVSGVAEGTPGYEADGTPVYYLDPEIIIIILPMMIYQRKVLSIMDFYLRTFVRKK